MTLPSHTHIFIFCRIVIHICHDKDAVERGPNMKYIEEILSKYSLTRDTTAKYIDAITRMNQTQTADEIGVSRDTVTRYKNAFAEMTTQERRFLIATLTQAKLLDQATE